MEMLIDNYFKLCGRKDNFYIYICHIIKFTISHILFHVGTALQIVTMKCKIVDEKIITDIKYMLTGMYNNSDVYLQYNTSTSKKWKTNPTCKSTKGALIQSLKCKMASVYDKKSYYMELVLPNVSSVVLGPIIPVNYKKQCVTGAYISFFILYIYIF